MHAKYLFGLNASLNVCLFWMLVTSYTCSRVHRGIVTIKVAIRIEHKTCWKLRTRRLSFLAKLFPENPHRGDAGCVCPRPSANIRWTWCAATSWGLKISRGKMGESLHCMRTKIKDEKEILKRKTWIRAALMCRASWNRVSSPQWGFNLFRSLAIRLCCLIECNDYLDDQTGVNENNQNLIIMVWMRQRTVCSFTLGSPVKKQKTSWDVIIANVAIRLLVWPSWPSW